MVLKRYCLTLCEQNSCNLTHIWISCEPRDLGKRALEAVHDYNSNRTKKVFFQSWKEG